MNTEEITDEQPTALRNQQSISAVNVNCVPEGKNTGPEPPAQIDGNSGIASTDDNVQLETSTRGRKVKRRDPFAYLTA